VGLRLEQLMDTYILRVIGLRRVPLDQQLMPLFVGQQRQLAHGLRGIRDNRFQQPLEVSHEPLDRRSSNRSVLYSIEPRSPPSVSFIDNVKSKFAVSLSDSNAEKLKSATSTSCIGAFWKANITWNSGVRLKSRSGCRCSTNCSNGKS
jgi:hypothetical protein